MLEKFSVSNYRNFENEISLDFMDHGKFQFNTDCLADGLLSKVLIYGKNGTGKSNLGSALLDIQQVLTTKSPRNEEDIPFLNACSDKPRAKFVYQFRFDTETVNYTYWKNEDEIVVEELCELSGKLLFHVREGQILEEHFSCFRMDFLNTGLYTFAYSEDEEESKSFLRWAIGMIPFDSKSVFGQLYKFVLNMRYLRSSDFIPMYPSHISQKAKRFGKISEKDLESFLNSMGFLCKLVKIKGEDQKERLYFDLGPKRILFYETASSGIKSLTEFYHQLHPILDSASFLYLDEFDAFFHYEMAENFLNHLIKKFPDTQIVFTTHNTDLMTNRLTRPDCLMILSAKCGITPLHRATEREIREGHNLEKMYHSGEFADRE